jgi:hypothetical protein
VTEGSVTLLKWLRRLLLLVGLGVVLTVGGGYAYLDWLTQAAVEQGAGYATGTRAEVAEADLAPWAGRLGVQEVTVANPKLPGGGSFQSPHFFKLGEGRFALDWSTLFSETVHMPELVLNNLHLHLERRGGTSNHQIILDRLEKLTESDRPTEARKYVIDRLLVENVTVTLRGYPGGRRTVNLSQPIELKNIGSNTDKGVLASEVTAVVMQAVFKSILVDVASLPKDLVRDVGGMLQDLKGLDELGQQILKQTGQMLPDIGDLFGSGQATDQAKDEFNPIEELGSGFGDLFNDENEARDQPNQP